MTTRKGRRFDRAWRNKISNGQKEYHKLRRHRTKPTPQMSEDHRRKIAESVKRNWERRRQEGKDRWQWTDNQRQIIPEALRKYHASQA